MCHLFARGLGFWVSAKISGRVWAFGLEAGVLDRVLGLEHGFQVWGMGCGLEPPAACKPIAFLSIYIESFAEEKVVPLQHRVSGNTVPIIRTILYGVEARDA